jgi:hypothetical protein
LEDWLSKIFIPVEPSERFIRRLKAKLIRVHGKRPLSGWMFLGTVAMALMLLLQGLGFALRILLLLFSLVGLMDRRRRSKEGSTLSVTGS